MLRLVLPILVATTVLWAGTQDAEACGDLGCHAMVVLAGQSSPTTKPEATKSQSIAPAADEAEVRAKDLAKTQPRTPEIWLQIKSYAYKQLPTHQEKHFTAVWIGMTVETPDETIAAVGLQGSWW